MRYYICLIIRYTVESLGSSLLLLKFDFGMCARSMIVSKTLMNWLTKVGGAVMVDENVGAVISILVVL